MRAITDQYDDTPESEWPGKRRREIDGPDRRAYVVLRDIFRRQCAAADTVCHCCEQPISYIAAERRQNHQAREARQAAQRAASGGPAPPDDSDEPPPI